MTPSQINAIAKLRIEQALDSMTDAFVLLDRDFRIAYVNPAAEKIAGIRASELGGLSHWEAWPTSVGSELERLYRLALATGKAQHFQYYYADADLDLWLEINAYPGEHGLALYYRDITQQKRERAEALRIERAYQAALSNTPDLVYVFDLNHRFTYANQALLSMWGRTAQEALGKNCLELGYPDWHAAMHDREIEHVIATRSPIRGEVPFTGTHGRRIYEYIFVPVLGTDGQVEAVAGTTRDVTDRQQAESILRASEERLRLAQVAGQLAIWDWDLLTNEVIWSPDSTWVYGRDPSEMTPISRCAQAVHPDDIASTMQALQRSIESGAEYDHDFRVLWPDGSMHWLSGRGRAVYDAHGKATRVLGLNADITLRKQAEEAVRKERGVLAELIQQAPAFMAVLRGPDHVFERTNALYQQLIGGRQVLGKPVREAIPEAVQQGFIDLLDRVYQTGEPFSASNYPFDLMKEPGSPLQRLYVNFVYQPQREADGLIAGIIVHGIDVTETRKATEALLQGEELAAAGRLAASIAHEINNPLEAITNLLFLIEGDTSLSLETRSYLETAQSELSRVSQIATQTLRFYRQTTKAASTSVREILESVIALYHRRLRDAEVHLITRYGSINPVLIYGGEVRQIAANLLGNALDATSRGGCIYMRERSATDWLTGRQGIRITIADTGHGMDRDTLQRAFDPFFSTKSATGTGLGLWVIKEIIGKHAGRIRVRSSQNPGHHGTVFSVFLPKLEIATNGKPALATT